MSLTSPDYFEVVRATAALLTETFGYHYAHGASASFSSERAGASEVLLTARLLAALKSLNPQLSESEAARAVAELLAPQHSSPASRQQHLHRKLIRSAPTSATDAAQPRYFAFDTPGQNDFLIVEQFTVQGLTGTHSFDLVVFANGIPIVIIEVAAPAGNTHPSRARLQSLQAAPGISRLFDLTQFFIVLHKNEAAYGAHLAGASGFHHWREPFPLSFDELRARLRLLSARTNDIPTPADVLVAGLLAPSNLLEMIQHFTFFEQHAGSVRKTVARYHQFHAVQQAMHRLSSPDKDVPWPQRGGFIWHAPGTGKTLTLTALALKLRSLQALAGVPLFVVTDCEKVRRQIDQTFLHHGLRPPLTTAGAPAKLARDNAGATIVTNVEAWQYEFDTALSPGQTQDSSAPPDVVLFDESHGKSEFGEHLRRALPQTCLISFTATPAHGQRACDSAECLHAFGYRQAQQEGMLVPAWYEARLPDCHVWKEEPAPPDTQTKEQNHAEERRTATAEERLAAIAQDVFEHYEQNLAANGYQAILLAVDDEAALRFYSELTAKLPERVALLNKSPGNEKLAQAFFDQTSSANNVLHHSHFDNEAFSIFITSAPLPVAFAAPKLQVIYLDQPATEERILQLISLTLRAFDERKTYGLLVDYRGVTRNLPQALPASGPNDLQLAFAPRFAESRFAELQQARLAALAFFETHMTRFSTEPCLVALEPVETRRAFARAWRAFGKFLDQLLPHAEAHSTLVDAKWLDAVRQEAASFYLDEELSRAEASPKVQQAMENFIAEVPSLNIKEYVSVYAESFEVEVNSLASTLAQIARVQHALLHETAINMARDPAFYESLQHRTQHIMRERQHGRSDDHTTLKKLWVEIACLRAGPAAQASALELSEDGFAFFGVLQKYLTPGAAEQAQRRDDHRAMANAMLAAIAPELAIVDWNLKEGVQREMRRKLKTILREARCPRPALEPLTGALLQLIHARFGKMAVY